MAVNIIKILTMITSETIKEVAERSGGRCEVRACTNTDGKLDLHHIYWRSQYRSSDRDEGWNLQHLCGHHHFSIHSQGNTELDRELKLIADKRKPKEKRCKEISKDILRARVARKNAYKRALERYKENNANLSPAQVRYRQVKAFRDKNKWPTRTQASFQQNS